MSYYAKIENNIVTKVIVAEADFFDTFVDDTPGQWLETKMDGSIRKNYAGIGFSYDATRNAFIPPKKYESWTLDETTCLWKAPVDMPSDNKNYVWNETTKAWDEVT
jgi:hypothetical protein|tara:strand:- start:9 stop:326 length:318 start_codon:yes stop_codon:yes gene_type:complete